MQKTIRTVDEKRKIVQVTTVDERWYIRDINDEKTGLPTHIFIPSVTWIAQSYPKGIAFFKWLANHGWDEAIALRDAAGDKGSKTHFAVNALMDGKEVKMNDKFLNPSTEQDEELLLEEYESILSFANWYEKTKPQILAREFVVWGDGYAGMVDMLCKLSEVYYVIDFKTSQYIWPSHEIQLSAYRYEVKRKMPDKDIRMAILQLGYKRNKRRWKLTEIEDKYEQFLAAKTIWANEHGTERPKQIEYPLSLKLELPKEETERTEDADSRRSEPE